MGYMLKGKIETMSEKELRQPRGTNIPIPKKFPNAPSRIKDKHREEAIPISWLTSKGMTMISNEARTELFKLIRAWREEQEERE